MSNSFYSQFSAKTAGEPVDFKTYLGLLLDIFKDNEVTVNDKDEVTAIAQDLFDRFVVPFDVPYIPEWVETIIEKLLRGLIPGIVDTMLTELTKDKD